jgi:hypothetical protein
VRVKSNNSHGIANESTAPFSLSVANSVVAANGGNGVELLASGTTGVNASISDSELSGNSGNAVDVLSSGSVGVIRVAIARNTMRANFRGASLVAGSPGVTYADVQGNNIVGNVASGVYAFGSTVTVSGNSITNNSYGIYDEAGNTIESISNNMVRNNSFGDVFGTVSGIPGT